MNPLDTDLQDRLAAVRGQYHAQHWSNPNDDDSPLVRSWERCKRAGLELSDRISFELVSRSMLAEIDDRYGHFVAAARPETQRLGEVLAGTGCVVLLTNHRGVIVDRQGDVDDALELRSISRVGVNLDERCVGTTAPSVVLDIWRPYLVGRDAHFCDNVRKFFCVAAPIESPTGTHLGVLDLTAYDRTPRFNALAMVSDASLAIENSMFAPSAEMALVRFHPRRELLGTAYECIVGVAPDGSIVGANRAALRHLGLARAELALRRFGGVFDRDPARLVARAATAAGELELRTEGGLTVHARVEGAPKPTSVSMAPALRAVPGAAPARPRPATPAAPSLDAVCIGAPGLAPALRRAQRACAAGAPVLLGGETGSGKEWSARMLHASVAAAELPFAVFDAATLDAGLDRPPSATWFIEELADLAPAQQARLERVLQERDAQPGAAGSVRLIVATVHDPARLLAQGRLRSDLYYRLAGLRVVLPPLRERVDLPGIVRALFSEEFRRLHGREPALDGHGAPAALAADTWAALLRWHWPGNFRELRQVAMTLAAAFVDGGVLGIDALPAAMTEATPAPTGSGTGGPAPTMRDVERHAIEHALAQCRGNLSAAARRLGVSRNTIYRRLQGGEE